MKTIPVLLPYGYDMPSEEDIRKGKKYVARREAAAHGLQEVIDGLLSEATGDIVRICYSYNIDPSRFTISSSYSESMLNEIADVMDRLEEAILDEVVLYSLKCTEDEDRKNNLLPWLLLLGKGNRNLRQTLEGRMKVFLKDIEAMVAALAHAKTPMARAVVRARSSFKAVYTMPEVVKAMKVLPKMNAENIRFGGVKHGNMGSSSSEANNIIRFATITEQMSWMRNQLLNFKAQGAAGYLQLRGSAYNCAICDDATGFYPNIDEMLTKPLVHCNCMCYRVPVFTSKEI